MDFFVIYTAGLGLLNHILYYVMCAIITTTCTLWC